MAMKLSGKEPALGGMSAEGELNTPALGGERGQLLQTIELKDFYRDLKARANAFAAVGKHVESGYMLSDMYDLNTSSTSPNGRVVSLGEYMARNDIVPRDFVVKRALVQRTPNDEFVVAIDSDRPDVRYAGVGNRIHITVSDKQGKMRISSSSKALNIQQMVWIVNKVFDLVDKAPYDLGLLAEANSLANIVRMHPGARQVVENSQNIGYEIKFEDRRILEEVKSILVERQLVSKDDSVNSFVVRDHTHNRMGVAEIAFGVIVTDGSTSSSMEMGIGIGANGKYLGNIKSLEENPTDTQKDIFNRRMSDFVFKTMQSNSTMALALLRKARDFVSP